MLRPLLLTAAGLALMGLAGCGPATARLKGKVVSSGQPVTFPAGQLVSVSFHPMKAEGVPDPANAYTCVLKPDGTFEFLASGGTLPPGRYRVVIASASAGPPPTGKDKDKAKPTSVFASHGTLALSKLEVEVASGQNDVVVDLTGTKPPS